MARTIVRRRGEHVDFKALLSALPVGGRAAGELFGPNMTAPMARRRDRWLRAILGEIEELETRGRLSVDTVLQNHAFLAVLLQATRASVDTDDEAKLRALQFGVMNAALSSDPDEFLRESFVPLIDRLTPLQLRLLWFCFRPNEHEATAQEIRGNIAFANSRFADLERRGLVAPGDSAHHSQARELTDLGRRLVEFTTDPRDAAGQPAS